jgi:hypothetical protein
MHNPDADFIAVVGRLVDRGLGQRRTAQLHDTATTVLTLPGGRSESRGSTSTATRIRAFAASVVYVTLTMLA